MLRDILLAVQSDLSFVRVAVLLLHLSFTVADLYLMAKRMRMVYQGRMSYQEKADSCLLMMAVSVPLMALFNSFLIPNFLSTSKNWTLFAATTLLVSSAILDLSGCTVVL